MIHKKISNLPPRFLSYCESLGGKLLAGDVKFIEKILLKVPSRHHTDVLRQYIKEFEQGAGVVDINAPNVLKMNRGRFAANTWLRLIKWNT